MYAPKSKLLQMFQCALQICIKMTIAKTVTTQTKNPMGINACSILRYCAHKNVLGYIRGQFSPAT